MGVPTPSQPVFTMSKIIAVLACLAVVLAVVSAESQPRYHKLEKLGCGLDQIIACAGEIEGAWNNAGIMEKISTVVSRESWELLTVEPVSVMFWDGWDSWSARWL